MIENEKVEELMLELEDKLDKTISVLEAEYTTIRAGRANPHVLDRVEVEAYGGMSKLIELGNISALDARCLQISVWDKSLLKAVEKAILQSNLGLTPTNDGNVIRIVFPIMTEERRKELVKQIKKMGGAASLLAMMPGGSQIDADSLDEKALPRIEAIIYSMTPAERAKPDIINPKRKRRIAAGSGTTVEDVNKLLRQFEMMQKMMKKVKRNPKGFMRSLGSLGGRGGGFRGFGR